MLEFFGIETKEKALKTLLWASPYLAMFAGILAGLSYLVQHYISALPLWMHGLAVLLSLTAFFLFVAWGKRLATDTFDGEDEDPSTTDP